MKNKIRWAEERRYVNAAPRNDIKFIDVQIDKLRITGVARHGKYVVLRMQRGATHIYTFYELLESIDKNALTDTEFLKHLVALDYENEINKKRIEELRQFADKLEEHLRDLPAEIVIALITHKSHGHVEVKLARQVDKDAFQRYVATCKALGMKFDHASRIWVFVPSWSQYVIVTYGP
jgi:hypothetical protein